MQHPYPYAALLAMCALGFSGAARSVVDGEIKAVNGTYEYLININNHDITSNQVGAVVIDEFDLAGMFQGRAYCAQPMISQPVYYTSQATLTQSGMTAGYLKLNDYMDVKIEIYIGGNLQQYKTVPFDNVSNNVNQNYCNPQHHTGQPVCLRCEGESDLYDHQAHYQWGQLAGVRNRNTLWTTGAGGNGPNATVARHHRFRRHHRTG